MKCFLDLFKAENFMSQSIQTGALNYRSTIAEQPNAILTDDLHLVLIRMILTSMHTQQFKNVLHQCLHPKVYSTFCARHYVFTHSYVIILH